MKRLDLTVPIGLLIGLVAIGGTAAMEGITPKFLWQPTAALIVIGGTMGAVVVRRGIRGVRSAVRSCVSLRHKNNSDEFDANIARLAWLARAVRREGVKVLETHAESNSDPLISRALVLTTVYAQPKEVRIALDHLLDHEDDQGMRDAATLESAGVYAPTFGVLGAVLGLIHVLRLLAEPSALGLGIATAFVATLYGIGLANLVFLPLAARLRERHEMWMKQREALADALVALASNESPNVITQRFASLVPFEGQNLGGRASRSQGR